MKTIAEIIEEAVSRLVQEFRPTQVVLFGSHAWGTPDGDSDLDLLVLVDRSDEKPSDRMLRGLRCLRGLGTPADVLVKTVAEFEKYAHVTASLEHKIQQEGIVLHGPGANRAGGRVGRKILA